jgi:hypothetical protein
MNIKLILFSIICLHWISCQPSNKQDENKDNKIQFKVFNYKAQTGNCTTVDDPCFKLEYSYPEMIAGPVELKESFNALMVSYIQEHLKRFISDSVSASHTEEIIEKLFSEYNLVANDATETQDEFDVAEFASMYNWYLNINASVFYEAYPYLSLSIVNSSHFGGAHPNSYEQYINFKLPSLVPLTLDQIVSDIPAVTALAENIFRTKYEIPEGESFSDHGYWFEEDVFILPENMALDASGLLFMYNPYEIGPYVFGSLEVLIPYELLRPYMILLATTEK